MREVYLDGRLITTKNRLYECLEEAFDFPDHFGRNLDAVWDVLNEETEPTTLQFTYVKKFLENMDGYGEGVLRMLSALNEQNEKFTVILYPYEAED